MESKEKFLCEVHIASTRSKYLYFAPPLIDNVTMSSCPAAIQPTWNIPNELQALDLSEALKSGPFTVLPNQGLLELKAVC